MSNKRKLGQYFTTNNPFKTKAFIEWIKNIPNFENEILLEPFAGSNNIPYMLINDNKFKNKWDCFDVEPSNKNKCSDIIISKKDTIQDFPKGYKVVITNPPYLSKNSATRRGLEYPNTKYDDIYKLCLDKMLDNCEYIAAIIPETFITSGLFHKRLHSVVSLTCKMFETTECPVCLALFVPQESNSFLIYKMDELIGDYETLKHSDINCETDINWKFNDPNGELGIWCIDDTKKPTIHFGKGDEISSTKIKVSSRSLTKVSGIPEDINLDLLIDECNSILNKYREDTGDVFMASFKGLRKDGCYRRRLDFATARNIMNQALVNLWVTR